MPIFTAAAAAIGTFFAGITVSSVAAFAVRTLVSIGISKLVANRANKTGAGANDVGARVQLGPATNNKLAVSYGRAFLAPKLTDAKITTDQKTMYYVFTLCEASSGTLSFGKVYWNGKEVTLGVGDYGANNKIISLTTNATPPQVDTTISGQAYIYGFINGSSSGVNTGGTSAITILSDAGIPVADRWTSTDTMTNTCFAVVKVIYNKDVQDAQQMPRLSVEVINTLTKPGMVIKDYMTDLQYGCAIDITDIDEDSLDDLDAYSDELITYVPVGGGTTTQPRYRIDGPVNTGDNCLSNLQQLVDACDSWLQYSELTGQWTIVINKPYSGVIGDLYSVDSSVLIGGIDINPIDLNQTYNSLEVQYPNANINDQTDYKVVDLTTVGTAWYDPSLLSPNEPDNRLTVQYPQINNYIRAVYLGVRRLLQSREDLTIVCNLDYSGIQVVAGDVVRVTLAEYGWADKLFRVSQVQETKTSDGFLGARITAFEYNGTIYADNALEDFIPEANTGLSDPNIFDKPSAPIVLNGPIANGAINYFTVSSNVPAAGTTLYMDFNYGNSSNVATHKSYSSVQIGDGTTYTANSTITINVADLNPATYYWSATARNDLAGRQSNSSAAFTWVGPAVTSYNLTTFVCAYSSGNVVTTAESTANVRAGMSVSVSSGTGAVAANTVVTAVTSANTFTTNPAPTTAFSCATLKVGGGGITYNQLSPLLGISQGIGGTNFSITANNLLPVDVNSTSTRNIPVYIPGVSINPNNYFPWVYATSSISSGTNGNNFYAANSTGVFTPNNASILLIDDGDDNWWKIIYDDFTAGTVSDDEQYNMNWGFTVVTDTDDTLVQVVTGVSYNTISYYQASTEFMDSRVLTAGLPVIFTQFRNFFPGGPIDSGAIFIRNLTPGTNVYLMQGSLASSKSPKSYF
jgi:hypothetical protein